MRASSCFWVVSFVACAACAGADETVGGMGGGAGGGSVGGGAGGSGGFEGEFPTTRPSNATCVAPARPSLGAVAFTPAYPNVALDSITALRPSPSGDAWYAATREGRIHRFPADPEAAQEDVAVVLDISDRVATPVERGLLAFAFSPSFADDGAVFVSYTTSTHSRISRFESADFGLSFADDVADEAIVFEHVHEYDNHLGGDLHFGIDGTLFFSFGDGGGDPAPAQDLDQLFGSILRIDPFTNDGLPTDAQVTVRNYGIPANNPFAGGASPRPEIWAYGFRNPWRMAIDPLTGDVWVGDVGEGTIEEVDLVVAGGNYGWPHKEGTTCYQTTPCDDDAWIDPVAEYTHADGVSVIGGAVYRGSRVPSLNGRFVFSEWSTGIVYATTIDPETGEGGLEPIADLDDFAIVAWGQGLDGELYAGTYGFPTLGPGDGSPAPAFPQKLSETGCFDPLDPTEPVEGVLPYAVRVELWSDGADKRRWLAIPDGTTIGIGADGHWELPIGAVLIKEFVVDGLRAETRLLVRHADGEWAGYSYKWDADGSDATLVPSGSTFDTGERLWSIPSAGQCMQCHTPAAGRSLGLETAQLNGDSPLGSNGASVNQIAGFASIGMFGSSPGQPSALDALPGMKDDGPLEARARAYLHVQCAHCHRPGSTFPALDLRWQTPLAETGTCDVAPSIDDLGVPSARLVVPGSSAESIVSLRMHSLDPAVRMPRLGTVAIDDEGVGIVDDWIDALAACP